MQVTRGIHTDCLLNYETVKYFGGEEHEGERYADAIREYQSLEYRVISEHNFLFLRAAIILTIVPSISVSQPFEPCSELHHC